MARGKHVGHKLFFGQGGGSPDRSNDKYIAWLWNKWRTMKPCLDPASLTTTEWDSDRQRRILVKDAPRPRHSGRRQATGGQNY